MARIHDVTEKNYRNVFLILESDFLQKSEESRVKANIVKSKIEFYCT